MSRRELPLGFGRQPIARAHGRDERPAVIALRIGRREFLLCAHPIAKLHCLVPAHFDNRLGVEIQRLASKKIEVSLFIDPDADQIKCARSVGANTIELHTGAYAQAQGTAQEKELVKLRHASELAVKLKLHLHAGHGLTYKNVQAVAQLPGMEELNIGFSIIARAVFAGLGPAVCEMKELFTCAG